MNTDNEKNINVTLKSNDDSENSSIIISFSTIFKQMKRLLALWIVISVIFGLVSMSVMLLLKNTTQTEPITTLVNYNYGGVNAGLAPDGNQLDVNKIKAPSIIETALTELDMPLNLVEKIRQNIEITGIMPDIVYDKISMYKTIYESGGTAALEAVDVLLDTGYSSTYYIIKFDNMNAGIDYDEGKNIINTMLNAYQDYFFTTYGYNSALGQAVVAIDYTEYDYPAAVDIFKTLLDDLDSYISPFQNNDFRSDATGYSFEDIRRNIDVLRSADLNAISSYITVYNVTNDKDQLITYYEYKIEELEREAVVLKSELESISDSINKYEKDSMLIFGDSENIDQTEYSQVSEKYDQLIEEKIAVQQRYSTKQQQVEYYKKRVETFKNNTSKSNADIEYVEEQLSKLNDKINNLIEITTLTSDEYYENIVFANAFNILVPAMGDKSQKTIDIIIPVILVEAVLFVAYIGYAFISAIVIDTKENKNKKEENEENNDTK